MADIGELLVSALSSGCIYGLMALSYLLILRPTGVINFALGEWSMLGAFAAVALGSDLLMPWLDLPHVFGFVLVVLLIGLLGGAVEILTVRPLIEKGAPLLSPVLALLGVLIVTLQIGTLVGGTEALPTESPFGFRRVEVGPFAGAPQAFYIIGATLVVFAAAWYFFERTIWGKRFEAVAINRRAAALVGINLRQVGLLAFVGSGMVCGVVGVLVSGASGAFYLMGLPLAIQGFTALVIGGGGRVEGALLGGLILGLVEAFAARYLPIPSSLVLGVPLVLLILFLLVRPTGLLPAREGAA